MLYLNHILEEGYHEGPTIVKMLPIKNRGADQEQVSTERRRPHRPRF